MNQKTNDDFFKTNVLGHPAGLLCFFFRNVERFLIMECVVLLTSSLAKGWAWTIEDALALYGTYTMAIYSCNGGFVSRSF
jgi:POT family proton-dependent oligopeptide transporter